MNELIKIEINENNEQLVSAKELHEFLEVKSKFADWIKNRIEKYGFEENQDFVTVSKNLENGGREIDYILKLDTAKELAMAENNEKKEKKMELMKKDLIMTSLEIAEITEKRHDHVLRDIREEIASLESEGLGGQLIFGESAYKNSQKQKNLINDKI